VFGTPDVYFFSPWICHVLRQRPVYFCHNSGS
jgi:hypothetical protein